MNLKSAIAITFAYYHQGRSAQDALVSLYAQDLADLDPIKCIEAYHHWRRNPRNKTFPLPAHIREMVQPSGNVSPQALAREVAARVVGAVTSYGWNNSRDARAFIGEAGWNAVSRLGGWMHICQNLGVTIQPTTFQAQLRDLLESQFEFGLDAIQSSIGAMPEIEGKKANQLQPIGDLLRHIMTLQPPDSERK